MELSLTGLSPTTPALVLLVWEAQATLVFHHMQQMVIVPHIFAGSTRVVAGITVDANAFALVYSGYFQPSVSGSYYICAYGDDEVNLYLSSGTAFSCGATLTDITGTRLASYYQTNTTCAYQDLTAGYLYPYLAIYGQIQGYSALEISITRPLEALP